MEIFIFLPASPHRPRAKRMDDLTVISTSIVRPENNDRSGRVKIHLTPWDLFFLRAEYPQRGLLFPKPDPETDIISPLKASLSAALEIFYPLAGRLVKVENEDNTESFYIDCDGSGAKFVHAVAKTVSVGDVLEPADGLVPDLIRHFFPANGTRSYEGVSESLLAVQVTEMEDGVFIGFGYNHMVADGSSFWKFFNTWSEICLKGLHSDHRKSLPPILLKGWFLDGIDPPIHIPISETKPPTRGISSSPTLQEKVFRFTKENISQLKAKANNEIGSNAEKISSLQAISGHMWRSIIRNSGLNRDQEVQCNLLANMRQRLNPPLETECFGNVVCFGTTRTTVGELMDHDLCWAALQINKMVGSITNENLRNFAEKWVKNVEFPNIGGGGIPSNPLLVASSPRFNVYGNDFGWGKPISVRAGPGNTSDGKAIVYPGTQEASIDIQLCLSSNVLAKLLTDAEFLESVTVA
ncbi:PREDICTED: uncharacterized acetyltransferase At3g50280-like [Tarenaya hassleriana]|uniref:uncharacterized acetyltransferase At3g50280-like n=1 Tax=Tarenaya hassleriana TaxID=28532 RepID=UPI00053C9053|nr:PREDICTED: uncharacterized acetyltransferase At3g50280-like [Tarenaya hassleriana]